MLQSNEIQIRNGDVIVVYEQDASKLSALIVLLAIASRDQCGAAKVVLAAQDWHIS